MIFYSKFLSIKGKFSYFWCRQWNFTEENFSEQGGTRTIYPRALGKRLQSIFENETKRETPAGIILETSFYKSV